MPIRAAVRRRKGTAEVTAVADTKAVGDSAEIALLRESVRDALAAGADWAQLDGPGLWSTIEPPEGSLAMAATIAEELGRALYAGPAYEAMVATYVRSRLADGLDIDPAAAPGAAFVCGAGDLDPIVAVPPETLLLVATGDSIACVRAADAEVTENPSLDVTRRTVQLTVPHADPSTAEPDVARFGRAARSLLYAADTLGCVEHVLEKSHRVCQAAHYVWAADR